MWKERGRGEREKGGKEEKRKRRRERKEKENIEKISSSSSSPLTLSVYSCLPYSGPSYLPVKNCGTDLDLQDCEAFC